MKCIRVITKSQPLTFDQKVAEDSANVAVVSAHTVQKSAKMASKGDYQGARMLNLAHKKVMLRSAKSPEQQKEYSKWADYGKEFESTMVQVQKQEMSEGLALDEMMDSIETENKETDKKDSFSFFKKKETVNKLRRNKRDDTTSTLLYNMKATNKNKFM